MKRKTKKVSENQYEVIECYNSECKNQLITLRFNEGDRQITLDEAMSRSAKLDLVIAYTYITYSISPTNCGRFCMVYRYFEPIENDEFRKIIVNIFLEIFPEAEVICDVPEFFFYENVRVLTGVSKECIYPERLFSSLYMSYDEMPKNKINNIKRFASENNIAMINGKTFNIDTVSINSINGKNFETPNILFNKRRYEKNSGKGAEVFIIYRITASVPEDNEGILFKQDHAVLKLRLAHIYTIEDKCKLISEFKNAERWLYHNEIWGILTNIVYVEGGQKYFRMILRNLETKGYLYDYKKWLSNLRQLKNLSYCPKSCSSFCPYKDECIHGENILTLLRHKDGEITILENTENYVDIETAREELSEVLEEVIMSDDDSIHIINAQTGIGKTEAYIDAIKSHPEMRFIIAAPTNDLKDEILARLTGKGIEAKATPRLPTDIDEEVYQQLSKLANKGAWKKYSDVLKEAEKKEEKLRQYKEDLKESMNYDGNLVTTHSRLVTMFSGKACINGKDFTHDPIKGRTIIVDEDIMKTIFHTNTICREKINYLLSLPYINKTLRDRIKYYSRFKGENEGKYCRHIREEPIKLKGGIRSNIDADEKIDFDLEKFINAKATMADKEAVYYSWITELPWQKIILLSATADAKVYTEFFKNQRKENQKIKKRKINHYSISEVRYKGSVYQLTQFSFSRTWIERNKSLYDYITDIFYKCTKIEFMRFNEKNELHFGNTEGKDGYSDKNLAIFGTPHVNDRVYKLLAASVDYDINLINNSSLNHKIIRYGSYEFKFYTYDDEFLKDIQIYYISNELEQSVGRARLLNNNNNVYVFANFPVKQAIFEQDLDSMARHESAEGFFGDNEDYFPSEVYNAS